MKTIRISITIEKREAVWLAFYHIYKMSKYRNGQKDYNILIEDDNIYVFLRRIWSETILNGITVSPSHF